MLKMFKQLTFDIIFKFVVAFYRVFLIYSDKLC